MGVLIEDSVEENWDKNPTCSRKSIFRLGLFGKLCATLCDPARYSAIVEELKTKGSVNATGLPDMPVNVQTTGAVPADHMVPAETYGKMMDATLMGLMNVRARPFKQNEKKKDCWVVTLQAN